MYYNTAEDFPTYKKSVHEPIMDHKSSPYTPLLEVERDDV
jgi:hypothetical protein